MDITRSRRYLSITEVVLILGVSLPTVNRRIKDGTIPSIKIGSRVLIPINFLDNIEKSSKSNKTFMRKQKIMKNDKDVIMAKKYFNDCGISIKNVPLDLLELKLVELRLKREINNLKEKKNG